MNELTFSKLSFKDWADDDKPREKFLQNGVRTLSNAELLAIIIGSGNQEESVIELAQRILASAGNNLTALSKRSVNQMITEFKGIGKAKAISIAAALELGKRRKAEDNAVNMIDCSKDIYNLFYPVFCDLHVEECWAIFLSRSHRVMDTTCISRGGVSETTIDAKLIMKEAMVRLASGLVLCHNHPSGSLHPSRQDDIITKKIWDISLLLDIQLIDHVIIGENGYFSYADEGKL